MVTFPHRQSAHCESGVVANLLTEGGLPMSEPMAFGLAGAMAFAYIPQIKVAGMPLVAYRMPPGSIIAGVGAALGLDWGRRRFSDPERGMADLDARVGDGRPFGMQTSVYWLPYFPEGMRFHFNAHNIVVYGREGDDYLISDPVFEHTTRCDRASLRKARFAKGALASRGLIYRPARIPKEIDYAQAIPRAIRANYRTLMSAPLPMIGVAGVRYLGRVLRQMEREPAKRELLPRFLGHIVRMQEEIGTGGAGFRFIYASFLQEAADRLGNRGLQEAAEGMTRTGDKWRAFALEATKMCRERAVMDAGALADILSSCAGCEESAWRAAREAV